MSSVPATESTEGQHPLIGATLRGTYRVVRLLDQGGMGMVFEAEHARLRKRLVVKVLAQHLVGDAHALARFNREAEIVSHLQHPHIVQVIDFDTTEQGEPYIVMELLQGESLAARLERERCLPLGEAVRIANQASSGLAAAHQAAIVHRDLKPANVFLVNMPGQGTLVKLLDFGISKRGAARGLTGEFDILGTPDYMAPEQALGKTAQVDHRGDQYALAVITYEMLSGRTPFGGQDVMEVLQQVIGKEPEPIEKLAPQVPAAVGDVLRRAMAKDPAERFPSTTEFAAALLKAAGTSVPPPNEPLGLNLAEPAERGPSATPAAPAQTPGPSNKPDGRYQTGLRSRAAGAPANATAETLASASSAVEVDRALEEAQKARAAGDLELAAHFAEMALVTAEKLPSSEAQTALESAGTLIEDIFLARLGNATTRIASVTATRPKKDTGVTPEQAFLLSRVEGGATLEEVLDLSPMPRRRTLRLLVGMLRQRLIGIEGD